MMTNRHKGAHGDWNIQAYHWNKNVLSKCLKEHRYVTQLRWQSIMGRWTRRRECSRTEHDCPEFCAPGTGSNQPIKAV